MNLSSVLAWLFASGMPNGFYVLEVALCIVFIVALTRLYTRATRRLKRERADAYARYTVARDDYEQLRASYEAVLTMCEGRTMLAPDTGELADVSDMGESVEVDE